MPVHLPGSIEIEIAFTSGCLALASYELLEYTLLKTKLHDAGAGKQTQVHRQVRVRGQIGAFFVLTFIEWLNAHEGMHWANGLHILGYLLVAINGGLLHYNASVSPIPRVLSRSELFNTVLIAIALTDHGPVTAFTILFFGFFRFAAAEWPDKFEANGFRFSASVLIMFLGVHWFPGLRHLFTWLGDDARTETFMLALELVGAWLLTVLLQWQIYPKALGIPDVNAVRKFGGLPT